MNKEHKIKIRTGDYFLEVNYLEDILTHKHLSEMILSDHKMTICRYTGLQDNDGNDIYEGDVFNIVYTNIPDGFSMMGGEREVKEVKGVVTMEDGCYVVKHIHPNTKKETSMFLYKLLENPEKVVVGNRYENPDLLDKKL